MGPPALSDGAKQALVNYLQGGGGPILIHFAGGAFSFVSAPAHLSPQFGSIVARFAKRSKPMHFRDSTVGHRVAGETGADDCAALELRHPA